VRDETKENLSFFYYFAEAAQLGDKLDWRNPKADAIKRLSIAEQDIKDGLTGHAGGELYAVANLLMSCEGEEDLWRKCEDLLATCMRDFEDAGESPSVDKSERRDVRFDLRRFVRLAGYLLPRSCRERVYDPSANELLADYLEARRHYRTRTAKRWLRFCFAVRLFWLFVGTAWVVGLDKLFAFFIKHWRPRM
jgi:hypothetical protein